jgi:tRNA (guanine-N7-)-methyltransferase
MYHIIPNTMRSKKRKFEEVKGFSNVLEWNTPDVKGKIKKLFKKYNNVVLELGCGKGEYTVQLAKKYPETLFIGIDIQGERIWKGAKDALEKKIANAYFLRIQVENIKEYIPKKSINEIWITFPDPFLRERQSKKRLTSPRFLEIYKGLLKKDGVVHLKTDSAQLYEFTKESIESCDFKIQKDIKDIYLEGLSLDEDISEIQTTFESKHLKEGRSIKYLRFG